MAMAELRLETELSQLPLPFTSKQAAGSFRCWHLSELTLSVRKQNKTLMSSHLVHVVIVLSFWSLTAHLQYSANTAQMMSPTPPPCEDVSSYKQYAACDRVSLFYTHAHPPPFWWQIICLEVVLKLHSAVSQQMSRNGSVPLPHPHPLPSDSDKWSGVMLR